MEVLMGRRWGTLPPRPTRCILTDKLRTLPSLQAQQRWNSLFSSGYGNQTPKTTGGRIFCVFYALIGIPLCLTYLAFIGQRIQSISKWLTMKLYRRDKMSKHVKVVGLLKLVTIGTCFMILFPSALFQYLEEWDYGTSVYYSVITLSTIGFGDYVAGKLIIQLINVNKKVLLRERKRHTARRVSSARYAEGGGVTPSQVGGYPVPGLGGTLFQVWEGRVGYPRSRGYPVPGLGGFPIQTWSGGYPRYPLTWDGVPSNLRWGTPLPDLGWGTPPSQTWDGVPPPARPGMGYPPDLGRGTPPPQCWTDRHSQV